MYKSTNRDFVEAGINKIIEEMMGFSPHSKKLADDILDYIVSEIKAGNILHHPDASEDFDGGDVYTLENHIKDFSVGGKKYLYSLNLMLVNYSDDLSDDEMNELILGKCGSSCAIGRTPTSDVAFVLHGNLIFRGWELDNLISGVFHHEIMHAYTHIKTLEENDFEEKYVNNTKYTSMVNIYQAATKLMTSGLLKIFEPKVCKVAASVYSSNKQEIASFTQQAYKMMDHVTSFSEVDKEIRETDLYSNYKLMMHVYKLLDTEDGLYDTFVEYMLPALDDDVKMPTKRLYMKILKKRCDKYAENIGKVIVYTKDRLRKDAVKEGYNVPVEIHDTTWSEIYKLGLY